MNELIPWLIIAGLIWLAWRMVVRRKLPSISDVPRPIVDNPPKEDPQTRHMWVTLSFVKAQHRELEKKQREHAAWERSYGLAQVQELDNLSGVEFERYLAGLFRQQGYKVELTPNTGDYVADLLLTKDGKRIAVQAKRYVGSVGIAAVQEALSGMAYYKCAAAWVVTTGPFTPNAVELAEKSSVRLIGRVELGKIIARMAGKREGAS